MNFDIATHILEYLGLRILDGTTVYFARFVDLIFKHLCPHVVFEDDVLLPVFQLNSRVFKDMIGTENKLQFVGNVHFPPQVRQLLQERMPTVYAPPEGAVVQEREEVNPPEPIPSSPPSNTIPPPSDDSQKLSVEKSKEGSKV